MNGADDIRVHPLQAGEIDQERLRELCALAISMGPPNGDVEYSSGWNLALSIEQFFDGNRSDGSIAANLYDKHPGVSVFRSTLESVRDREDVTGVQIALGDFESDDQGTLWPHADRVFIYTTAKQRDVESWLNLLAPDEVAKAKKLGGAPVNAPDLPRRTVAYAAWWD